MARSRPRFTGWCVAAASLTGLLLAILFGSSASGGGVNSTGIQGGIPPDDAGIMFVENSGQFDARVRFRARTGAEILWLTEDGIWITLLIDEEDTSNAPEIESHRPIDGSQPGAARAVNLKLWFTGTINHPNLEPFARMKTNITIGSSEGPSPARGWGGVRFKNIFPGIDLVFSGSGGHWSWYFDGEEDRFPVNVSLAIEGANSPRIGKNSVELVTAAGRYSIPVPGFASESGMRSLTLHELSGANDSLLLRAILEENDVDKQRSVLDVPNQPAGNEQNSSALFYSTYFGSNRWDEGDSIDRDDAGNAYVTGHTQAITFTTTTGTPFYNHGIDVYALKLNAGGSALEYFLWFFTAGLSAEDYGRDIVVDDSGYAYVAGWTQSADFCSYFGNVPGYDTTYNGSGDAFLMKISPDGLGLEFCTYIGGQDIETGASVAVDGNGDAYVTGGTWSLDFPTTPDAFDESQNGLRDGFLAKIDESGTTLLFGTYYGGSDQEEGTGIDVGQMGEAVITGWTKSTDIETTAGAFDRDHNGGVFDAFLLRLSAPGDELLLGTYLGGEEEDRGTAVVVNNAGETFVAGMTKSSDFPTTAGAFDTTFGGGNCDLDPCPDAFVARLNAQGSALIYSSYLGGAAEDEAFSMVIDGSGQAYIVGHTLSATSFPTTSNAFDSSHNGESDVFISTFNPSASRLTYSSFLGGSDADKGYGIALGGGDKVFLTGITQSLDFPTTPESLDPIYGGDNDAFISRLDVPILRHYFLPALSRPASS